MIKTLRLTPMQIKSKIYKYIVQDLCIEKQRSNCNIGRNYVNSRPSIGLNLEQTILPNENGQHLPPMR